MTHDIDDLLLLIIELEQRVIALELKLEQPQGRIIVPDDSWYWDH
jgi:hypothetical protein